MVAHDIQILVTGLDVGMTLQVRLSGEDENFEYFAAQSAVSGATGSGRSFMV